MTNYRRAKIPGGTYFFTVTCLQRQGNNLLTANIDLLRNVIGHVKKAHPFTIDGMVVLPDHLHCVWSLPHGDADYKTRWALIKAGFSRRIAAQETVSDSRLKRGERGLWQRRYWEHLIRDEEDYRKHLDYIHWNPVKHGWVQLVADWPYSSFHKYVRQGVYSQDWAGAPDIVCGGEMD